MRGFPEVRGSQEDAIDWHMYNNAFLFYMYKRREPQLWNTVVELLKKTKNTFQIYLQHTGNSFEIFSNKIIIVYMKGKRDTCWNTNKCKPLTTESPWVILNETRIENLHVVFTADVTEPVGWLRDSRTTHNIESYMKVTTSFSNLQFHFTWIVTLDKRVHITIQFRTIVMPTIDLYKCSFSYLRIFNNNNNSQNNKLNNHYKYCGLHSFIALYCPFIEICKHFFKTEIFFLPSADFQVNALYTISNCLFHSILVKPTAYPLKFIAVRSTASYSYSSHGCKQDTYHSGQKKSIALDIHEST